MGVGEGISRNAGNSNAKGKRPRIVRHPRVERWVLCRQCDARIEFTTSAGHLVPINPDGSTHPCRGA